jgi:transposase
METLKTQVTKAGVVHVNETGIRADGKLLWVHNSSTDMYTYQKVSQKRGVEEIIENGFLANFKGISVHDCWIPY